MPHLEKKLKSIEEKFSKVKCFLKWMVSVLLQEVQRRGGADHHYHQYHYHHYLLQVVQERGEAEKILEERKSRKVKPLPLPLY